jgi:hypothetical protein
MVDLFGFKYQSCSLWQKQPIMSDSASNYGLDLPDWVAEFLREPGGIDFQEINLDRLLEVCQHQRIDRLFVDESFVDEKRTRSPHIDVMNLLEQGRIGVLTVYSNHPWHIPVSVMDKLDQLAESCVINMIVNGYFERTYSNIKVHNIDAWEQLISHYFNMLLAQQLHKTRQPTRTFMVQTVLKDPFRKAIGDHLAGSTIWQQFASSPGKNTTESLDIGKEQLIQDLERQHGPGQYINALRAFGNGLPNFKIYEQAFCEIVLETRVSGDWHFTEKTFRPIALGIPIVHLGHRPQHDRLLDYGYQLYDNGFYEQWHSGSTLTEKLPCLSEFLEHIHNSESVQDELAQTARHNYQLFWNQRKNSYYSHTGKIFDVICGGETLLSKVYKRMDV